MYYHRHNICCVMNFCCIVYADITGIERAVLSNNICRDFYFSSQKLHTMLTLLFSHPVWQFISHVFIWQVYLHVWVYIFAIQVFYFWNILATTVWTRRCVSSSMFQISSWKTPIYFPVCNTWLSFRIDESVLVWMLYFFINPQNPRSESDTQYFECFSINHELTLCTSELCSWFLYINSIT